MKNSSKFIVPSVAAVIAAGLLSGCATGQKRMEPVGEQQKSEIIQSIKAIDEVKEQPALEPEWADYVKDSYPNWRHHYWVDRGQWGNRGYITGRPIVTAEQGVEATMQPLPLANPEPPVIYNTEPPVIQTPEKPTKYTVRKGDSLWRISGRVYGNPLKWPRIYRANKDKIKNPNKIHPGMVLNVPQN